MKCSRRPLRRTRNGYSLIFGRRGAAVALDLLSNSHVRRPVACRRSGSVCRGPIAGEQRRGFLVTRQRTCYPNDLFVVSYDVWRAGPDFPPLLCPRGIAHAHNETIPNTSRLNILASLAAS